MKNIAPHIYRQRLMIEAFYTIEVTKEMLDAYLRGVAEHLNLKIYGDPIIFSPATGMGKEENQGFDAFVPLIDSGISAYVWSSSKFFSVLFYTCKSFDEQKAIEYTKDFFKVLPEFETMSF
ncbi:MAG TPA: S-adenosylmethionine decarboxylase [Alphaproteobacteria bacterium]|nr:S-adenosylmethionine decarboxylase [Alphaproteobacteria bacterium]